MKDASCIEYNLEKLDQMAQRILEEIGIKILSSRHLELLAGKGVKIEGDRIFFTKTQIRDLLGKTPGSFPMKAPNSAYDVRIGDGPSQITAGYGCSSIMDANGNTRGAKLSDHLNFIKLVHQNPCFNINGGILAQPTDVPTDKSHLIMHYVSLVFSDKCMMGMPGSLKQMEEIMELTAIRLGGMDKLCQAPQILTMISPISPLQLDDMGLSSIEVAARYKQPIIASPGVAAGTTGPIDLAGNIAMASAEALSIILISQLINPGTPVIFGLQCYGSDMKSGNISIGSPAYALQAKYCAALAKYYGIPSRCGGTTNDARELSAQAGYESMLSMFTACQNNVSLIIHGAGILDSFASMSYEKFIMDIEIIDMIRFYLNDLDVSANTLNFDLIKEIGPGGLYITSLDTMKKCRTHIWNPTVALRGSLKGLTPREKFLQNIDETKTKMLKGYQQTEIDWVILTRMERFMKDKGVDPSSLPLLNT